VTEKILMLLAVFTRQYQKKLLQNMPMIVQRSKAVKGACGSKITRGGDIYQGICTLDARDFELLHRCVS
jgi:hypothetical protein